MNKDITYHGFSAVPSDYQSQDGDLAISLNLVPEDGAIHPVHSPKEILSLRDNERILLIHNVPGQKNYIIIRSENNRFGLYWMVKDNDETTDSAVFIVWLDGFNDITAIGNTLIIATPQGLQYLLWKDSSYLKLGQRPPFVSISFGLRLSQSQPSKIEQFTLPVKLAPVPGHNEANMREPTTDSDLADLTTKLYGMLLPIIADEITSKGHFYQPFFVRYAYKMYDGTYGWHSAPILMLPSVTIPLMKITEATKNSQDNTALVTTVASVTSCDLMYRIISKSIAGLADWSDIISAISVFISAPIYTYDQSKNLSYIPWTSIKGLMKDGHCTHFPANPTSGDCFLGHYAGRYDNEKQFYIDHYLSNSEMASDTASYWRLPKHEKFIENIKSAHDFYFYTDIDIKKISRMDSMESLPPKDKDLSNLVTRPALPDDYSSHTKLIPSSLFAYNGRLNLGGMKIEPPEPFPITSMVEYDCPASDHTGTLRAIIRVWTRINGCKCIAVHDSNGLDGLADAILNIDTYTPRYLYYPDASAYKMEICANTISNKTYIFDLEPHDFLNGAYFFDTVPTGVKLENAALETEIPPTSVHVSSKIYTSEINNPFSFPVNGINNVGAGTVLGISSASKALSQGQFGQFPLYAFTTEGVWAMELTANGLYSAKQPITRDVCINPSGITQIDSAVMFPTDRGIMLLSGSDTLCITDSINNTSPISLRQLPHIQQLTGLFDKKGRAVEIAPFVDFLTGCRMLYDYIHQRIIVYNKGYDYAYIYSLKSKLWGMMLSSLSDGLNAYPEALAHTGQNKIVNFSLPEGETLPALLITRPLKLDAANIHKTIDNIIQRGNFRKGNVQSVLYGSRDLVNWHLVWSSKDHFLRGFRGTPYKYFRIALLCNLASDESILGASVQFTPRLTNQPR